MATYTPVPRTIASAERTALITLVAAGDKIDITDVLGRPARGMQMYMTATTDIVSYKLNHLTKIPTRGRRDLSQVPVQHTATSFWDTSAGVSEFSGTGDTVIETVSDLTISSIEITALTLSTGTTISIVVW